MIQEKLEKMPMEQSHFVPMDTEPRWRLRLFLGRLRTGGSRVTERPKLPFRLRPIYRRSHEVLMGA